VRKTFIAAHAITFAALAASSWAQNVGSLGCGRVMDESSLVSLERARADGRERLGRAYATDVIDADELDRRLDALERADEVQQVQTLLADLAPELPATMAPAMPAMPVGTTAMAVAAPPITAWFSETTRTGIWTPAWHNEVKVRFATVRLDFREARLLPGITTFVVDVVMAELEIIVPPGLAIDVECSTFFGEVERDEHRSAPVATSGACVRIVGDVWFASVSIREMLVGETKSAARKRRKRERKLAEANARRAIEAARD
jgi:hypothetical protein